MATNMDPDSEVFFKEKVEEKEIKGEGTTKDATIRFDFQASTPAMPQPLRMERQGEGLAPVSVFNRWSTDIFRRAARAGEYGVPSQGRGPLTPIRTGNRHEHHAPGAGRPEERKESVG